MDIWEKLEITTLNETYNIQKEMKQHVIGILEYHLNEYNVESVTKRNSPIGLHQER